VAEFCDLSRIRQSFADRFVDAGPRYDPRMPPISLGPSLFSSLADVGLERVIVRRRADRGELLFREGDDPAGLWAVETGRVRLYTSDVDGREQTLQIVGAGDSFNEVPFFDRGPEPVTAEALDEAELLVVPQRHRDVVLAQPMFAARAAEQFAARLRQTVALVADLSFRQVTGRVALVLLQTVEPRPGVGAGAGPGRLTQREIAEMAGTSREVVARSLRKLEDEGLIRTERGRIVLLDREGLVRRG
jgi:CRP/FNR family transcriptional regulator, cyclic AMP receptor protein